MAYLEEMLMRQAVAAQEQQAARVLLQRLRQMEQTAAAKRVTDAPLEEPERSQFLGLEEKSGAVSEREAMSLADALRERETVAGTMEDAPSEVQHSNAPVQRLLRQLAALAGDRLRVAGDSAMEEEMPASQRANWLRMEQRISRAAAALPMTVQRSERLASEGPRSLTPYGQADAAALSRLYERDARRYDSRFELPL